MPVLSQVDPGDEEAAREWLVTYNREAQIRIPVATQARWDYSTNLTDHNMEREVSRCRVQYTNLTD